MKKIKHKIFKLTFIISVLHFGLLNGQNQCNFPQIDCGNHNIRFDNTFLSNLNSLCNGRLDGKRYEKGLAVFCLRLDKMRFSNYSFRVNDPNAMLYLTVNSCDVEDCFRAGRFISLDNYCGEDNLYIWIEYSTEYNPEGQSIFAGGGPNVNFQIICEGPPCLDCDNADELICDSKLEGRRTLSKKNNVEEYCNGFYTGYNAPEHTFTFEADETRDYIFSVHDIDFNTNLDIFILDGCDQNNCIASTAGTSSSGPKILVASLNRRTEYIVVVDGKGASGSTFDIDVICEGECFENCCEGEDLEWLYEIQESATAYCSDCPNGTANTTILQCQTEEESCFYKIIYSECSGRNSPQTISEENYQYYRCDGTAYTPNSEDEISSSVFWDCKKGLREECLDCYVSCCPEDQDLSWLNSYKEEVLLACSEDNEALNAIYQGTYRNDCSYFIVYTQPRNPRVFADIYDCTGELIDDFLWTSENTHFKWIRENGFEEIITCGGENSECCHDEKCCADETTLNSLITELDCTSKIFQCLYNGEECVYEVRYNDPELVGEEVNIVYDCNGEPLHIYTPIDSEKPILTGCSLIWECENGKTPQCEKDDDCEPIPLENIPWCFGYRPYNDFDQSRSYELDFITENAPSEIRNADPNSIVWTTESGEAIGNGLSPIYTPPSPEASIVICIEWKVIIGEEVFCYKICKRICFSDPYNCNLFWWYPYSTLNDEYKFQANENIDVVEWQIIDESGNVVDRDLSGNNEATFNLSEDRYGANACIWIIMRYWDGFCYRICWKKICLTSPNCGYDYITSNYISTPQELQNGNYLYQFKHNLSSSQILVKWKAYPINTTNQQVFESTDDVFSPEPFRIDPLIDGPTTFRICIIYFENGCYKICCIDICLTNPYSCVSQTNVSCEDFGDGGNYNYTISSPSLGENIEILYWTDALGNRLSEFDGQSSITYSYSGDPNRRYIYCYYIECPPSSDESPGAFDHNDYRDCWLGVCCIPLPNCGCYYDCCNDSDLSWLEAIKEVENSRCNECPNGTANTTIKQCTDVQGTCFYEIARVGCDNEDFPPDYFNCDGSPFIPLSDGFNDCSVVWDCKSGQREECCLENCCKGEDLTWLEDIIENQLLSSCDEFDPNMNIQDGFVTQGMIDNDCRFAVWLPASINSLSRTVHIYNCSGTPIDTISRDIITEFNHFKDYWNCKNGYVDKCPKGGKFGCANPRPYACEEFENYTPDQGINNQSNSWMAGGGPNAISGIVKEENNNNYLQIGTNANFEVSESKYQLPSSSNNDDVQGVSMRIRIDDEQGAIIYLNDEDVYFSFQPNNNNHQLIYGGNVDTLINTWEYDKWFELKFLYKQSTQELDILIDGRSIIGNKNIRIPLISFRNMTFYGALNGSNTYFDIDNICLCSCGTGDGGNPPCLDMTRIKCDDIESYNIGDRIEDYSDWSADINESCTVQEMNGNKYVSIKRSTNGDDCEAIYTFENTSSTEEKISYRVQIPNNSGIVVEYNNRFLGFSSIQTENNQARINYMIGDKEDDNSIDGIFEFIDTPIGQWFEISIILNKSTRKVSLVVDGKIIVDKANTNESSLSSATWNTQFTVNGEVKLDDVCKWSCGKGENDCPDPIQDCDILSIKDINQVNSSEFRISVDANLNSETIEGYALVIDGQSDTTMVDSPEFFCPVERNCYLYVIYRDSDGCLTWCCIKLFIPRNCSGGFEPYYTGDGYEHGYNFLHESSSVIPIRYFITARDYSTTVEANEQFTLPYPGTYTICCLYYDPISKCYGICCIEYCFGYPYDPVDCPDLTYEKSDNGEYYSLEVDESQVREIISWRLDSENGELIGTDNDVLFYPEDYGLGDVFDVIICIRYIDLDGCIRVCCIRICEEGGDVFDPDFRDCDLIDFTYTGQGFIYEFCFNELIDSNLIYFSDKRSKIKVKVRSSANRGMGSSNSARIVLPDSIDLDSLNCIDVDLAEYQGEEVIICFEYIDAQGCLVQCCKKICLVQSPITSASCDYISRSFSGDRSHPFTYSFNLNIDGEEIDHRHTRWTIHDSDGSNSYPIGEKTGNLSDINFEDYGYSHGDRVCVTVVFYNPVKRCIDVCCVCFCLSDPYDCNDIRHTVENGRLNLSIPDSDADITWSIENTGRQIESSTSLSELRSDIVNDTITICAFYFDPIFRCYRYCCQTICVSSSNDCSDFNPIFRQINDGVTIQVDDITTRTEVTLPSGERRIMGSNSESFSEYGEYIVCRYRMNSCMEEEPCCERECIALPLTCLDASDISYSVGDNNLVTFNYSGSNMTTSKLWSFGDGGFATTNANSTTYQYDRSGGRFEVCVDFRNECDECQICSIIELPDLTQSGSDDVIFEIGEVCGPISPPAVIVPVKVTNFKGVKKMTGEITLENDLGRIVRLESDVLGDRLSFSSIDSRTIIVTIEDSHSSINLDNGQVAFEIIIEIQDNGLSESEIFLKGGSILDFEVIDQQQSSLPVSAQSGLLCLSSTVDVLGTIRSISSQTINDVTLTLSGPSGGSTTTNTEGNYSLSGVIGESYVLSASKEDGHLNGVTPQDILLLKRHILSIEGGRISDPYVRVAADVNDDKVLNSLDEIETRRLILGDIPSFMNNEAWRFIIGDQNLGMLDPLTVTVPDYTETISYNPLRQSEVSEDFIGIKIGDLNTTAITNLNDLQTEVRSQSASFNTDNIEFGSGDTVTVQFKSSDFDNKAAFLFELNYSQKLEYLDFLSSDLREMNESSIGKSLKEHQKILVLWTADDAKGRSLSSTDDVVTLRFLANANGQLSEEIGFTEMFRSNELFDEDLTTENLNLEFNTSTSLPYTELTEQVKVSVSPNPFLDETIIEIDKTDDNSNWNLSLFTIHGKHILDASSNQSGHKQIFQIGKDQLGNRSGVIIYQLSNGAQIKTGKLIRVN